MKFKIGDKVILRNDLARYLGKDIKSIALIVIRVACETEDESVYFSETSTHNGGPICPIGVAYIENRIFHVDDLAQEFDKLVSDMRGALIHNIDLQRKESDDE